MRLPLGANQRPGIRGGETWRRGLRPGARARKRVRGGELVPRKQTIILFQQDSASCAAGLAHWRSPALGPAEGAHALAQDRNGKRTQHYIPNRWLVLRMWHAEGDATISSKAWVVESDFVSPDATSEGMPFPFFGTNSPDELKGQYCGYVGRAVAAEDWQETHPKYRFELTSFGWGDPSFAAYYPACKKGLGFWDNMEGVASDDRLTYLVIGWYSDPARDPLHAASAQDTVQACTKRLADLGWSCSSLAGSDVKALPRRTLASGGVVGVAWQGFDQKYRAVPAGEVTAAIAGSAAEALAALLAPDKKDVQQVLCAFQHGQATQVSELDQLGDLLHRHGFSAVAGGVLWTVEPEKPDAPPATAQSPPPLSTNVQNLLGKLNAAQQALDQQARKVESLRGALVRLLGDVGEQADGASFQAPQAIERGYRGEGGVSKGQRRPAEIRAGGHSVQKRCDAGPGG